MSDTLKDRLKVVTRKRAQDIGPWKGELLPALTDEEGKLAGGLVHKYGVGEGVGWAPNQNKEDLPFYEPDSKTVVTHPFEGPTATAHELGHNVNVEWGGTVREDVIKEEEDANKVARHILKDAKAPSNEELLSAAIQTYMSRYNKKGNADAE